ncbi:hypothetical protein TWF481_002020 [Arthrobotrys musiformis]|uniref:Carboxymuconolactone decarboxylase-like domain-containing protein n=1 Tax=Arthrobotrys musiformis TaxID=47236 RepID=A0AAV9VRZ3_9PEZI
MSIRYPPITPGALDERQKEVHDLLAGSIGQYFNQIFTIQDKESEALVGPFTQFLYLPKSIASGYFANGSSLSHVAEFPLRCREIAILAVGQYYQADYELYSHVRVAKSVGVEDRQIENILDGRPPGGTDQEELSWEIARSLVERKGPLPAELWKRAELLFGKPGAGALIHYAGFYAYTSIILNGAAVSVPTGENIWPIT